MIGVNSAGLTSKLSSFDYLLSSLEPSIFFIEETKMKSQGRIKTKNSQKYQIFELLRKNKCGGGIAIGALEDLNPVWIAEGDDEVEVLVIQIEVQQFPIRCIGAYGPQEKDKIERKLKFWARLSKEVEEAYESDCAIVFQMDGNLWAGNDLIKGDPNECNNNGRLFKNFLQEHPYLCVVNSLALCEGIITRRRKCKAKTEEAVLDFFVVCDKIKCFIEKLIIDEKKEYPLTRYMKHGKKDSDHHTMIFHLQLNFIQKNQSRIEMFNFKNLECQSNFYSITETKNDLINCFENGKGLELQTNEWFKNLFSYFHQSFVKIRSRSFKKKLDETDQLLSQRTKLIQKLKKTKDKDKKEVEREIEEIEGKISDITAEENRNKVVSNFATLKASDGTTNQNGVWSIKRKLFPNNQQSLPLAKKDMDGKLVTSQKELRKLYLSTFTTRLRHRPIKKGLENLKSKKEELWSKRLELSSMNKSRPWKLEELIAVLSSLKAGKSRDPHQLINELFKPDVGGKDFQVSFLLMANKIKNEIYVPKFMQYATIVSIYKGKGSKMELDNERGIFIVNIFRSVLMKMIYNDKYETVDKSMSDSNVGARKHKNIRNHIFVLNGVINEVINNKETGIDIGIMDYRQCFDSMWMEESMNDLWEAGIKDDKLALIYKMNEQTSVSVKTPFGNTESEVVRRVVMQGETFGPLCCSVQVDTFGKECIMKDQLLHLYKNEVGIPPLAMVDDLVCISKCGLESVLMNAFINAKSNMKKLQFGSAKCHKMHVGSQRCYCPQLTVDNWELKVVKHLDTGETEVVDELNGQHIMETSDQEKYLGDIISNNGKNKKNIEARVAKGIGIVDQILSILSRTVFGPFQFEVALILRSSLLLSGILTNSEAWYGLKNEDMEKLEQIDESLLRKILEVGSGCPKEMLYLEMGVLPIRFVVMCRRLMFLHYIINEDPESLVGRVFTAQEKTPGKNDWCLTVENDMEELGITLTHSEIRSMTEFRFKSLVKPLIYKKALSYLNNFKLKHTKVMHIEHMELSLQEYLRPKNVSGIQLAKFLFQSRSRMLQVKANFSQKYKNEEMGCPLKCNKRDSQEHLLECEKINPNAINKSKEPLYRDLFSKEVEKQKEVAIILKNNLQNRKELLDKMNSSE